MTAEELGQVFLRLQDLGDQLEARFGRRLTFGTGIHTGPAVVGNVGAPDRMDYTGHDSFRISDHRPPERQN